MRHCVQVEALRYQYLNKPIQTTTEEDIPRRRKLLILEIILQQKPIK